MTKGACEFVDEYYLFSSYSSNAVKQTRRTRGCKNTVVEWLPGSSMQAALKGIQVPHNRHGMGEKQREEEMIQD